MESKEEKPLEGYGVTPQEKKTSSDSGDDNGSYSDSESQSLESSHDSLTSFQDDHQRSFKRRKIDSWTFTEKLISGKESDTESDLRSVEDEEEDITSSRSPIHSQTYKVANPEMFMDDTDPD